MTCLYFSSKIEKVLQTGPLYTTLEYLHFLQILNKTLLACFYHGVIPISCVFSFFIFLFFRHFTISVSFVFISFFFFFLQTLCGIYFFCILFFCLFLLQTNHHIFLLLVYSFYLSCFCSILLLYLAPILCFFDSRSNRHYSPLFIYLKKKIFLTPLFLTVF